MNKTGTDPIRSAERIFREYKALAEKALAQLSEEQLVQTTDAEANSVFIIMRHLAGNMKSRWTDFLSTDGEKEWRERDREFENDTSVTREAMMKMWNEGWDVLFYALEQASNVSMGTIVKIRGEEHSVLEAVNRQLAHYSYHVGQIVFIARMLKGMGWTSLSIPRNQSGAFNQSLGHGRSGEEQTK
jgi:hypothetical protein